MERREVLARVPPSFHQRVAPGEVRRYEKGAIQPLVEPLESGYRITVLRENACVPNR